MWSLIVVQCKKEKTKSKSKKNLIVSTELETITSVRKSVLSSIVHQVS